MVHQFSEGEMNLEKRSVLDGFRASRSQLLALVDALSDDDFRRPRRDGWSVKDHLAHLAHWDDIRTLEALRLAAGYASAIRSTSQQDDILNQVTFEWRRDLSREQVLWELATSRGRLVDAIAGMTDSAFAVVNADAWPLRTAHELQHLNVLAEMLFQPNQ